MSPPQATERNPGLGSLGWTILLLSGYVAAFLLAWLILDLRISRENPADVEASSGMYAFGDGMYFLFVFCIWASLPTGFALSCLRRAQRFWSLLVACALLLTATGVLALATYFAVAWLKAPLGSGLENWGALSALRLLFAPIPFGASLLGVLFAPDRRTRTRFFLAVATEGFCGLSLFVHLAAPFANGLSGP